MPLSGGGGGLRAGAVRVPPPARRGGHLSLHWDGGGSLTIGPAQHDGAGSGRPGVMAELWFHAEGTVAGWWLAPRERKSLAINGVPPLPLAALEPGDLLSVGPAWWLVTSPWAAEPQPAPEELSQRPCPVCGGALGLAPVAQCTCGRYYHLESPGAEGDDVLNCFLSGPCGLCNRQPTLDEILWPEPPAKLFDIEE